MIVSSALMIWKGLMVVTGSESPIVVVLSGSMEPAFQVSHSMVFIVLLNILAEGWLALPDQLWGGGHQGWGDCCVQDWWARHPDRTQVWVHTNNQEISLPSLRRVLKLHEKEDGSIKFLTKVKIKTHFPGLFSQLPRSFFSIFLNRETTTAWMTGGYMHQDSFGLIERFLSLNQIIWSC